MDVMSDLRAGGYPEIPGPPPELPRRRHRGAGAAVVGVALMAFLAPPAIFRMGARLCATACGCGVHDAASWLPSPTAGRTDGAPNDVWGSVEPGLVQVLAQGLIALVLVVAGVRAILRGRRPPLARLRVLALAPLGVALVQIQLRERAMAEIVAAASSAAAPRLHDYGRSAGNLVGEIAALLVDGADFFQMGAIGAGVAMLAVAVAGALALSTIDETRIGPPPSWAVFRGAQSDRRPPSTRAVEVTLGRITLAVGLLALTVSALAHAALVPALAGADVLAIALVLVAIPIAATAVRPLPALVAHQNPGEAGDALRDLASCAFAVAAAVALFDVSAVATELRGWAASTEPSCLGRGWALASSPLAWSTPLQAGARVRLLVIDTVACLAVFAPAWFSAVRANRGRRAPTVAVVAAVLGALGAVVGARIQGDIAAVAESYAVGAQAIARTAIALPVSHDRVPRLADTDPVRWILTPGGLVNPWTGPSAGRRATPLLDLLERSQRGAGAIAADASLPASRLIADLLAALPARSAGALPIQLVAAPPSRLPPERFGALAGLRPTDLVGYPLYLHDSLDDLAPDDSGDPHWLGVLPDGDHARVVQFLRTGPREITATRVAPPMALESVRKVVSVKSPGRLVVAPPAGMTVAGLLSVVDRLGCAWRGTTVIAARVTLEEAIQRRESERASRSEAEPPL